MIFFPWSRRKRREETSPAAESAETPDGRTRETAAEAAVTPGSRMRDAAAEGAETPDSRMRDTAADGAEIPDGMAASAADNAGAEPSGEGSGDSSRGTEQTEKMYIIAGLGNPGRKYEKTRHNCGFEALDILADRARIDVSSPKFHALCGTGAIDGQKVLLMKPQTYMNLSGQAVQAACAYYKVDPAAQLIVLYDDISLEPGQLRIRAKGSAGGHNGIKNIIQMLGTDQFLRVKIGTGRQPSDYQQVDWVLGHFPPDQRADMEDAFDRAARAAQALLTEDPEQVMSQYNRRQEKE